VISTGHLEVFLLRWWSLEAAYGGHVTWTGKKRDMVEKPFINCQYIRLGTTVDDILK
jgi:hypothetical protein